MIVVMPLKTKTVNMPAHNPAIYDLFVHDFSRIEHLFTYNAAQFPIAKRMAALKTNWQGNRHALVESLAEDNRRLGAGEKTLQNIQKLRCSDTVAIVTGQQAGLYTGPLLTIYKTLTALYLAQTLTQHYRINAVPVFWAATEDHDFAEVNHIYYLDARGLVQRLNVNAAENSVPAIGSLPLGKDYGLVQRRFLDSVEDGPFKERYAKQLWETLEESTCWADWFGKQLLSLFANQGLIYLNPMLAGLRSLAVPFWHGVVNGHEEIARAIARADSQIKALGLNPAVVKPGSHTHLFAVTPKSRQPIYKQEHGFRAGDREYTTHELLSMMAAHPARFSPDVLLRPVLQDYLLPTAVYVAGPGEVNYWAQLRYVFEVFNLQMPLVYPRASFTLVDPEIGRLLERCGVDSYEEIWQGLSKKKNELLLERDALGIKTQFQVLRENIAAVYNNTIDPLLDTYKNLKELQSGNLHRILHQLGYLEHKIWQQHGARHRDIDNDLHRILLNLYPKRRLQEQIFNIYTYLFHFGEGLIGDLLANHNRIGSFEHQFFFIGR